MMRHVATKSKWAPFCLVWRDVEGQVPAVPGFATLPLQSLSFNCANGVLRARLRFAAQFMTRIVALPMHELHGDGCSGQCAQHFAIMPPQKTRKNLSNPTKYATRMITTTLAKVNMAWWHRNNKVGSRSATKRGAKKLGTSKNAEGRKSTENKDKMMPTTGNCITLRLFTGLGYGIGRRLGRGLGTQVSLPVQFG